MKTEEKEARLVELLRGCGSLAIAFSGGVDSSYLAATAKDALGDAVIAVTVESPCMSAREREAAREMARDIGLRHRVIELDDMGGAVLANPPDRCYHCKKAIFLNIADFARREGFLVVAEGSNTDDALDYRPGARAIRELGVASPLADAGLAKAEIRALSRRRGLATWDKPALACLATRFPYGEAIDAGKLGRVEAAERYLADLGFRQFRVRSHGDIARIEVAPEERARFFDVPLMDAVSSRIKQSGFLYVSLELSGYSAGSLNLALSPKEEDPV